MKENKEKEVALFAMEKFEQLDSFVADQTVTAGGTNVEVQVKFKKPRKLTLEYGDYTSPLEQFEQELTGGPELCAADLKGAKLIYDGKNTWIHLPGDDLALLKRGKWIQSPFGDLEVFGQLAFLKDLIGDYLLKYAGEGDVNGREVHRLGLKPKRNRRSLFLKEEVFDFDHAQLALSKEHGLPLKITYYPGERGALLAGGPPGSSIIAEYENFQLNELERKVFNFDPSKVGKVFRENRLDPEEFAEEFPLSVDFDALNEEGFRRAGERLSVMEKEDGDKSYCRISFVKRGEGGLPQSLQLMAGNYLSKEMGRHRTQLAEKGSDAHLEEAVGWILDRGASLEDRLPQELRQKIVELGWEKEGNFYFLLGQGMDKTDLRQLAEEALFN